MIQENGFRGVGHLQGKRSKLKSAGYSVKKCGNKFPLI